MKISFCMTTFNKKELLEVTLENYLKHKKDNYELIISDGCSTDGTREYLYNLAREKKIDIALLPDKRDSGEWEGYKRTLDYVTGDYAYFLTDDDCFDFNAIDLISKFLDQHPNVDYVIANGHDLRADTLENLNYHKVLKANGTTNTAINKLKDGVCGLGIFVKAKLLTELELFSTKYGKRTDKTLTLALMNSSYTGASTDVTTYVSIKNEKSNSYLSKFDYSAMQVPESLMEEYNKDFVVNIAPFQEKFNFALSFLHSKSNNEFVIYNTQRN